MLRSRTWATGWTALRLAMATLIAAAEEVDVRNTEASRALVDVFADEILHGARG